jgi:SAM-dependent methyltransferase
MRSFYDSRRVADRYAYGRPPVHRRIVKKIGDDLGIAAPVPWALDIGCGAGLSTAALGPLAGRIVGIDRSPAMLAHSRTVAPGAMFLVGEAESLPFAAGTFQLITAAGSINYADLTLSLPEAARILAPGGTVAIYDFSAGRRLRDSHRLEEWHREFECRYPRAPGYHLDVRRLNYGHAGLRLDGYAEIEVPIEMSLDSYLPYAMSETRVELAIASGVPEAEIRGWCRSTLGDVLEGQSHEVLFDAYVAYVRRNESAHESPV